MGHPWTKLKFKLNNKETKINKATFNKRVNNNVISKNIYLPHSIQILKTNLYIKRIPILYTISKKRAKKNLQ